MTNPPPARTAPPPWLQPSTERAMRAAYDGTVQAGQGDAAAIAAACTVLLAQAPGLTPSQIGEALGAVALAAEAGSAEQGVLPPFRQDAASGQPCRSPAEANDADLVAALAYALRHDERGKPRKGGWDFAAELAAEHLAGHLRRANFVVSRRRPGTPHRAG